MERHFHEELQNLKKTMLEMGQRVNVSLDMATQAVLKHDRLLANQVLVDEQAINRMEIEIDEQGHSLFALAQPMARDLRLITMILKINTVLERLGDHAVNIAERVLLLVDEPCLFETKLSFPEMALTANEMVRDSLEAFLVGDVLLAKSVLERDDAVDEYNEHIYNALETIMGEHPEFVVYCLNLVIISHNIERIADLASNIAENVIYSKDGKEVRHHSGTTSPAVE
jgi:phosphate transport system protein